MEPDAGPRVHRTEYTEYGEQLVLDVDADAMPLVLRALAELWGASARLGVWDNEA
jgi:hypothetical protein